jgi:hypothetical protein
MLNIKHIFLTTGISILFGVYSIYNILEYLRITNYYRSKEISDLYKIIYQTNRKYVDLNNKYNQLQEKYEELVVDFRNSKEEIINLNIKNIEIENFNDYIFNLINSETTNNNYNVIIDENIDENVDENNNENIDETINKLIENPDVLNNNNNIYKLNIHFPKLPRSETITPNFNSFVKQNYIVNSNSDLDLNSDVNSDLNVECDYHYVDESIVLYGDHNSNGDSSICSSITNDNELEISKKYFFGLFG